MTKLDLQLGWTMQWVLKIGVITDPRPNNHDKHKQAKASKGSQNANA